MLNVTMAVEIAVLLAVPPYLKREIRTLFKKFMVCTALIFCSSAIFYYLTERKLPDIEGIDAQALEFRPSNTESLPRQHSQENQALSKKKEVMEEQLQECLSIDLKLTQQQREQEHLLSQYINEQKLSAISGWKLQRIAVAVGFSPETFRAMEWSSIQYLNNQSLIRLFLEPSEKVGREFRPLPFDDKGKDFDAMLKHQANQLTLLKQADYQGFISYRETHQLSSKLLYGEDFLSAVFLLHPDISTSDVSYLLNNQIQVSLKSLVMLSELEYGLEIAQEITNLAPKFQYDIEWQSGYFFINLVLDAVQRSEYELAQFWLSQSLKPYINLGERNALDYFPEPTQSEYPQALTLLKTLVELGTRPNFPDTIIRLKSWVKREDQELLERLTMSWSIPDLLANDLDVQLLQQRVNSLAEVNKPYLRKYNECKQVAEVTSQLPVKVQPSELISQPTLDTAQQLQRDRKNFEHYAALSFQELLDPKSLRGNKASKQKPNLNKKWRLIEFLSSEKVKELLDEGYKLPESAINRLAKGGRIDLIEQLIPFGINIHYVDEQGKNALFYAIDAINSEVTFNYLRTLGISIISGEQLLTKAIERAENKNDMAKVIRVIIDAGIQPTETHRQVFTYRVSGHSSSYAEIKQLLKID